MDHQSAPSRAPRPDGYVAVAPWLISTDTSAELRFLSEVFGASEKPGSRVMSGDHIHHLEVDLAGTTVMLSAAPPTWRTPGHLRIYVHDVDKTIADATALGATVVTMPTLLPFGDRVARLRDPQGHLWWIHQHVKDVGIDEMVRRVGEPDYIEAREYVGSSLIAHMDSIGTVDPPTHGFVVDRHDGRTDGDDWTEELEELPGAPGVSLILESTTQAGIGPRLHRHPYAETFVIRRGTATFTIGGEVVEAHAGQVLVAPAGVAHKFVTGPGGYEAVHVHAHDSFVTEWLE